MESFYGGRKGASFTLVKSYDSIEQMNAEFLEGASSLGVVGYGEYVLIDTIVNGQRYSDPDNGKIYRRGFEGAEYVGQIVGPKGAAPELSWTSYVNLLDQDLVSTGQLTVDNQSLVPGYVEHSDGSITRNAEIKYAYINLKNDKGDIIGATLGMQIPYTSFVFDVDSEYVSFFEHAVAERQNDSGPFYEHWLLTLPQGVTGEGIRGLNTATVADATLTNKDSATKEILQYQHVQHEIGDGADKYDKEIITTHFLADYNIVDKVVVQDDGSIVVKYTAKNDDTYEKMMKWISSTGLSDTGTFTINYNNGAVDTLENFLTWVKDINLTQEGLFTVEYNNDKIQNYSTTLVWAKDLIIADDGTLTVKYNTGDTTVYNQFLKSITNVQIKTDETGAERFYITDNTKTTYAVGDPLNYIEETVVTEGSSDNPYHLYVYYTDPNKRGDKTYNGKTGWTDLGYVRGDLESVGIIGSFESVASLQLDGEWLTPQEVEGYDTNKAGWGYTIGNEIWFYDYNQKIWYTPGSFIAAAGKVATVASEDSVPDMQTGGIWFISESSKVLE